MQTNSTFKVAAAQVAPIFLKLNPTISKACSIIGEAANNGAELVVFPEAFIPAFPVWSALQSPIHNHDMFVELASNAVTIPGPELDTISDTAREKGVFVSIGLNEGTPNSTGCLWNSNVIISDDGSVLCHHRKITPTFYEKLISAPGDRGPPDLPLLPTLSLTRRAVRILERLEPYVSS